MSRVDLYSPLTPEECVGRLRAGMLNQYSEVEGRLEHDWIRLRKRIFFRNSFQTFLMAKLIPDGGGTRIRGSLGIHPLVIGLLIMSGAWLVLLGALAVANGAPAFFLLGLLALALFNAGMIWFGRWLARGQDRFLMEFVACALTATSVTDTTAK